MAACRQAWCRRRGWEFHKFTRRHHGRDCLQSSSRRVCLVLAKAPKTTTLGIHFLQKGSIYSNMASLLIIPLLRAMHIKTLQFISTMNFFIYFNMIRTCKGFNTLITFIRFLSSMCSFMYSETTMAWKGFSPSVHSQGFCLVCILSCLWRLQRYAKTFPHSLHS